MYYLWKSEIAAFLLEHGMNPDHMNCHHTTVLHDMAYKGETQKIPLLLDHGAELNAIDDEFRSTPLGVAARWGRRDVVAQLIERGADPNASGAAWATPLAWARKKGHADVESDLQHAGARQ
jgi:ankyrin repeat protein